MKPPNFNQYHSYECGTFSLVVYNVRLGVSPGVTDNNW